jgi:tetratricopeptide (TPR) repeat protein
MRYLIFSILFLSIISCIKAQDNFNLTSIKLNNLAIEKMKVEDYDTALVLFDEAIAIDSTYFIAYNNKVNCLVAMKDFSEAIKTQRLSLEIKPDLAEGYFFLGMLLDSFGDSVQATNCYYESIELFKYRILKGESLGSNKLNLATAYLFVGQTEKADSIFKKLKENENLEETIHLIQSSSKENLLKQILGPN